MDPERCDYCDFDGSRFDRPALVTQRRSLGPHWKALIDSAGSDLTTRPAPGVWSAIEYAVDSRDITALHVFGVEQALTEDEPRYPEVQADLVETAAENYAKEQPAVVVDVLDEQAKRLATLADESSAEAWARAHHRYQSLGRATHARVDAEPRHQAVGRIINPGVDHFAVARGRFGADPLRRLQDDHLPPGLRQRARDREPDHTGTDNDAIHFFHGRSLYVRYSQGVVERVRLWANRSPDMRIAVIGAGGVGGAFGAALAKAGADVTFVARGAHLAAMRAQWTAGRGRRGDTYIHPCRRPTIRPDRSGRCRALLRQAVGRGKRRRGDQAADRTGHGGDPAAERHRCGRPADPHPRAGRGDGRRGADQRDHRTSPA